MKPLANNLIVRLKQKYYDSVTFDSGVMLHIDPMWHPEEWAMLTAEVLATPEYIINRHDYRNMKCNVQPGDQILVRYDLVFAYNHQPDRDTPIYKNLVLHFDEQSQKHEEYWMCDIQKVFAIIRDGEYIMQNEYVMVEPLLRMTSVGKIWTPDQMRAFQPEDRVKVLSIDNSSGKGTICPGDEICIIPSIAQQYRIDQKSFWIIRQRHILAKISA